MAFTPPIRRKSDSKPSSRLPSTDNRNGDAKSGSQAKMPPSRTWLWFLLVLGANYLIVRFLIPGPEAPVTIPYTFFKEEVAKHNVKSIYSQGESITGRFASPVTYPPAEQKNGASDGKPEKPSQPGLTRTGPKTSPNFTTTLPSFVGPGLEGFLINNGVEISAKPIEEGGGLLSTLLFGFGPALLFIGFYVWMFRRAQQGGGLSGGLMGIGKSRARRYDQEKDTKVTFDDVAGIDEAENELVEIVDFLRDPKKYTRLGGTAPKGVLLIGAPGTGKTLLAKAGLATKPLATGSGSVAMTIGIVAAFLARRVADGPPVTMTCTFRAISSSASVVRRSNLPSAYRHSMIMFFPST